MKARYVSDIIEQIRAERGSKKKIEILNRYRDDEVLQKVLFLTYNPYVIFGIKKIPEYSPLVSRNTTTLTNVLKRLETQLMSGRTTGNKAIWLLQDCLESLDPKDSEIVECVIQKNIKAGISTTTINKVWPGLIPVFNPMACADFDRKNMKGDRWLVQNKSDGMRAHFFTKQNSRYQFFTRAGREFDDKGRFQELRNRIFEGNLVIDGEIRVLDKKGNFLPRKKGNGICNKGIRGTISEAEADNLVFIVWDIMSAIDFNNGSTSTTEERFKRLESMFEKQLAGIPNVELIEYKYADSEKEIFAIFDEFTKKGEEGVIVKNLDQVWETKRSKGWQKLKIEKEMELRVEGAIEGLGKNLGSLGALRCTDASGRLSVNVGGGFSDEQRQDFWARKDDLAGCIITVKYNEILVDEIEGTMSLFLGRFIEERLDKTEPDDAMEILKAEAKKKK